MHVGFVSGTGVPFFEGAVSSGKANCVGGRKVSVLFARNRGLTTLFGRTKTDSAGNFTMAMKSGMRVGGYFARVKKTGNCKFDDSSEVPWSNNDTTFSRAIAWMNRHR
jgi:hypothetical protein